ncbi:hypothetical protein EYF80_066722 [Liparis tanakae]|uniref:Uncharacterized protein n=1 Tax=Liparis tanakae TaxID=230148 RepID=A0A4Z2E3M1_9TELE|nr:hypothetical protein EYF80_066722 [Liparis tanakae]
MPAACCMLKPLKFSMRTKPLIWVSSFSSSFSRITQYALKIWTQRLRGSETQRLRDSDSETQRLIDS